MTNKKRLGLAVPLTLHKKLVSRAEYQGKTINALCLDIFWDYFESRKIQSEEIDTEKTNKKVG